MWRATWRSLLARKVRLLLTGIAIVLGVGFISGTYVLTDTLNAAFNDLFTQTTRGVDVQVQGTEAFALDPSQGGGGGSERQPIPGSVATQIEGLAGVQQVVGNVQGYAQLVDPVTEEAITTTGAPTIGSSWTPLAGLEIVEGSEPTNSTQVAIDAGTAKAHNLSVGDQIRILFEGPAREFTISAVIRIGGTDSLLGATLAVFDTSTAQDVLNRPGAFDFLSVVAKEGVAATTLRDEINSILPEGYEAITGETAAQQAADAVSKGLGFLQTFLLVFAMVALFVGAFIIFNTFNIIVTQRVRELGLLRTLGASRRQVMVSVVVESLLTGLLASAVGLVAGIGIASGLQALLKGFGIDVPSTALLIKSRTIVVSMVLGTLVTVVASVAPARRASRVAPIEALRETGSPPTSSMKRRSLSGAAVTLLGVGALGKGLFTHTSNAASVVGLGAALTFIGVAILSPLFTRPLAGWIGAPFNRRPISGRLGRQNSMRNPRRTASTAAALMIGLGLVSFVAVASASLKASASAALDKALKADYIVSGSNFNPFSPQVAADMAADPAFEVVSGVRQNQVKIGTSSAFITAIDPSTFGAVSSLEFSTGGLNGLEQPGGVLLYKGVATSKNLQIGDEIRIGFASTGVQPFTVEGIYTDSSLLGDYAISIADYETNFVQQLDVFALATLAPGVDKAQAGAAIDRVTAIYPNVQVQDQTEFKETQAAAIDRFLGLVTALLLMAILIALFGIVNTLGLSIYERIREIGLLRAVGMSRKQVKRMIRVEAVIIAILGAILGVAIGILFGIAMQQALKDIGITKLAIPVGQLIVYMVIAGLAGVVAAFFPARRAAKLNVLQAISYE